MGIGIRGLLSDIYNDTRRSPVQSMLINAVCFALIIRSLMLSLCPTRCVYYDGRAGRCSQSPWPEQQQQQQQQRPDVSPFAVQAELDPDVRLATR